MAKTIKGRTQNPAYTAAVLKAKNPVLLKGEVVYESDTRKHKIGDGSTAWNDLPYAGGGNFEGPISASKITQDANHRFVTDAEKQCWNDASGISYQEDYGFNAAQSPDGAIRNLNITIRLSRFANFGIMEITGTYTLMKQAGTITMPLDNSSSVPFDADAFIDELKKIYTGRDGYPTSLGNHSYVQKAAAAKTDVVTEITVNPDTREAVLYCFKNTNEEIGISNVVINIRRPYTFNK